MEWLNEDSRLFLSRGYLTGKETAEERIKTIASAAQKYLNYPGFEETFHEYMSKGFYSLASPIWSNFGKDRGLPISCNSAFIEDSMDSILGKVAETGMLTKYGAGTSAYFGALRKRGAKITAGGTSSGPVHFMELFDSVTNVVSQSNIRRGSFAAYLDIEHPDIEEFLQVREEGHPIQNLSLGVCISDAWMHDMVNGNKAKRAVWAKVLKKRFETGYPYLFFTDTVNRNKPQVYKDKDIHIYASNLCSEITLPSSPDETFVCDLSSMNIAKWNEWRNTDAVFILTLFLDAVMSEYIDKTENIPFIQAARKFAIRHRALGVGGLGWHTYLQQESIPFESMEAKLLNTSIWKHIDEQSLKASKYMAEVYGEPELLKGYGLRNTTRLAVAPTKSSSFILGQVSASLEPIYANYYVDNLAKGKFTIKNAQLKKVLQMHGKDTEEVWDSILNAHGSVYHLPFLSEHEKNVFKTFAEISQKEIIIQAAARQKYIDQSQSLNLKIHPSAPLKDINALTIFAWKSGIKTLYYQKGVNPSQALRQELLSCVSCEG